MAQPHMVTIYEVFLTDGPHVNTKNIDFLKLTYKIESYSDETGTLSVLDFSSNELPFTPKRMFYIYGSSYSVTRGEHAHLSCKQMFIQISGECKITLHNSTGRGSCTLNNPKVGILADEMTWCEISNSSKDSVLLVLASDAYDPDDYIYDYTDFMSRLVK
jgi:UDP-2-acetamido-3-amino-2,3-dideoxy-glucuronate N-acetyltransferase